MISLLEITLQSVFQLMSLLVAKQTIGVTVSKAG